MEGAKEIRRKLLDIRDQKDLSPGIIAERLEQYNKITAAVFKALGAQLQPIADVAGTTFSTGEVEELLEKLEQLERLVRAVADPMGP